MKYKIIRFFMLGQHSIEIKCGLTLEEAQAHCNDPETSSSTCTLAERKEITEKCGDWYDGYMEQFKPKICSPFFHQNPSLFGR